MLNPCNPRYPFKGAESGGSTDAIVFDSIFGANCGLAAYLALNKALDGAKKPAGPWACGRVASKGPLRLRVSSGGLTVLRSWRVAARSPLYLAAARAALALALASSAFFCSSAASASAFLASASLAAASCLVLSPPMAPAMALPAIVPATAPTAAAPMVPIMPEPPAAGAAAAGAAPAGAAALPVAGAVVAGAVAGLAAVLAAGAAGAAFCVAAGRDLKPPPMRLAWAKPGNTRPATVKAITEAEVRIDGVTVNFQKSGPGQWAAACAATCARRLRGLPT